MKPEARRLLEGTIQDLAAELFRRLPEHPRCAGCGLPMVRANVAIHDGDAPEWTMSCPGVCDSYGGPVPEPLGSITRAGYDPRRVEHVVQSLVGFNERITAALAGEALEREELEAFSELILHVQHHLQRLR